MVGVGGGVVEGIRAGRDSSLYQLGCRPCKSWTPFCNGGPSKLEVNFHQTICGDVEFHEGLEQEEGGGGGEECCHGLGGDHYALFLIGLGGRFQQ